VGAGVRAVGLAAVRGPDGEVGGESARGQKSLARHRQSHQPVPAQGRFTLAAGSDDRLALELVTPTAPITIRRPDDEETFSLLMPVRLDD